jgi:hypothetical protein
MSFAARVRPHTLLLLTLLACTEPSGPSTGNLRVTVMGLPPGTAGSVTVTGPGGFSQSVASTQTFSQITPGTYTISGASVTASSVQYTPSPAVQNVAVVASDFTANVNVVYSQAVGGLTVTITGLGTGSTAAVTVTGPGYSQNVPSSRTLSGLAPGSYTVTARDTVANGGTPHSASPATQTVDVVPQSNATANVTYTPPPPGGPLNLRIAGMYLTQSAQTYAGSVPLVQNRDGYLRVFVVADRVNAALATVKVRFFNGLVPVDSVTVSGPTSVPTAVDESSLSYTWNLPVAGSLIQPTLRLQAEVDPNQLITETVENDNVYPVVPPAMDVRAVPPLDITFVPVIQFGMPVNRRVRGDVTTTNQGQFLSTTRKMHPVAAINSVVRQDYTTTTTDTLQALNGNQAWTTILLEIDALRKFESSARYYYGVAKVSYTSGVAGIAYVSNASAGARAALGWDYPGTAGVIAAHELGHNWARIHSPCGGPADVDPQYPQTDGTTGIYGMDVAAQILQPPTSKDIMGYCDPKWISDYTYSGVMNYLLSPSPPIMGSGGGAVEPALLVWGYIRNGQPVLEPAFQLNARPSLPAQPGPYALTGQAADGSTLFSFSFTPDQVADAGGDQQNFAYVVPLPSAKAARLATIRVAGRGRQALRSEATSTMPSSVGQTAVVEAMRLGGAKVRLRWNPALHPMAVIRDPQTGQVLSFARGGEVELSTTRRQLDIILSNGVRSQAQRMRVP